MGIPVYFLSPFAFSYPISIFEKKTPFLIPPPLELRSPLLLCREMTDTPQPRPRLSRHRPRPQTGASELHTLSRVLRFSLNSISWRLSLSRASSSRATQYSTLQFIQPVLMTKFGGSGLYSAFCYYNDSTVITLHTS